MKNHRLKFIFLYNNEHATKVHQISIYGYVTNLIISE